jgi:hypothetical protein
MSLTKRPKSVIVLGLLHEGYPVTFDGREYWLVDGRLGIKGTRHSGSLMEAAVEEVFLYVEVSLDSFIQMCDKLTDEDVSLMVANKALTDIKRKD